MDSKLPEPYYQTDDGMQTIYCGDSLELLPLMEPGSVDLVVTDIPYNISQKGVLRSLDYGEWDKQYGQERSWISSMLPLVKQTIIVFCHKKQFSRILEQFEEAGLYHRTLIWHKPNPTVLNCEKFYIEATELMAYGKRTNAYFAPTYKHNIFEHQSPHDRTHPTQKPLPLLMELTQDCSRAGNTILDPFLGSGTTLVACQQLGRRGIGIEIEEKYCEVAKKRLAQYMLPGINK